MKHTQHQDSQTVPEPDQQSNNSDEDIRKSKLPGLLIVEHDPVQLNMLSALMETEGFEVISCKSPGRALELSTRHKFDVAIVDLRLPEIAGTALLEQIKVLNDDVRVIMYTGHGTFEAARDALNLGAFAFVEKSADPAELIEIARRAREAAQQERRGLPDPQSMALRRTVLDLVRENRERCRAERQQEMLQEQVRHMQKMDAVGTLAAGIAHDFNNLLMVIMAFNTAIRNQASGIPNLAPAIDGIEEATRQAADLVSALVTFSRKSKSAQMPLDLLKLVSKSVDLLRATFPSRFTIELDLPEEPVGVKGDPSQLQQVLFNLGTNARDAMPAGGTVTFTVACNDDTVWLRVADSGVGMDESTKQRVFEPFFTTKARGQGAGLGLAVVHGVVADHGGTIDVESAPGGGTTFCVRLPRSIEAVSTASTAPDERSLSGLGRLAAVIEDNEQIRAIVVDTLARAGFRVEQAEDGWRGVELIERLGDRLSIVILDLDLPGIHGLKVLEQLRRKHATLPVLIITGDGNLPDDFDEAAGGSRVLFKPATMRELLDVLGEMLASSGSSHVAKSAVDAANANRHQSSSA